MYTPWLLHTVDVAVCLIGVEKVVKLKKKNPKENNTCELSDYKNRTQFFILQGI